MLVPLTPVATLMPEFVRQLPVHLSYTATFPAKGDTVTVSATEAATSDVYFDPYDVVINADPYPTYGSSGTNRRSTTTRSTTSTRSAGSPM